mgnify:CR=1 FL=1
MSVNIDGYNTPRSSTLKSALEKKVEKLEANQKLLCKEIIPLLKESIKSREKIMELVTRIECTIISNSAIINSYEKKERVFASTFADRLKQAREKKGMSQSDLARSSGLTRSVISKWENADFGYPSGPALRKAANALDISVDDLLGPINE